MSKAFKHAFDKLTHHHSHHKESSKSGSATPSESGEPNPHPLVLPHIDTSDSSITGSTTSGSTTTLGGTTSSSASTAIPSDVNSPVASGATTPVDERGNKVTHSQLKPGTTVPVTHGQTFDKSHGHGHGKHDAKHGNTGHNDHDDIHRTGSLNKVFSQKCEDLHEHFKAIKLHHSKASDSTATAKGNGAHAHAHAGSGSATPARPPLNHTKTEEDERALRIERQEELHRESLRREAAAKHAYENDPLNGNYGFLNIDATPNKGVDLSGKKDTFLEIAKKSEGDEVYFRARIQSLRKQSECTSYFTRTSS